LRRPVSGHSGAPFPAQGARPIGDPVNTRTIAIAALVIAVIVLLLIVL
jgi:hypothetical protein